MLHRELTYQMPYEKLAKLSRLASRKAFGLSWLLGGLLLVSYAVGLALWIGFDHVVDAWLATYGLPSWLPLASLIAMLIIGFLGIRRLGRQQMKSRVNFDSSVRFRQESDGLRFATSEIEYFLKWNGISQVMLVEKEGVLFSHGSLFFLVPNSVFADAAERDTLAREVYARLSDAARKRSEKFVKPVLKASDGTARA